MCIKWENHPLPSSLTSLLSFNHGPVQLNFHNWSKETKASELIKL
jgi:hypothetical protein